MANGSPLLTLTGLSYRHPVRSTRQPWKMRRGPGVHSIDLQVERGTILGLIGPNGAGKTTLLHTIAGLHPDFKGDIEIGNTDSHADGLPAVQRKIGLMPERVGWVGSATPRQILHRLLTMRGGGDDIDSLLKIVGLHSRADSPLDEFSQGMRQRLSLAAALLGSPDVLLLDEPMNGLDPVGQAAFRGLVRSLAERGKAVIVSSHNLNEMEQMVDSVAILYHGQLVADGRIEDVEKALEFTPSIIIAGSGWVPKSESLGRGIEVTPLEPWGDETWRIEVSRFDGRWTNRQKTNLLNQIIEQGGEPHLFEPLATKLEDLLAAATGLQAEDVGLEVGIAGMVPVRTWEVGEDE